MRFAIALALLLLFSTAASAGFFRGGAASSSSATGTSTIYSFDSGGTGVTNQIGDWTTDGDYVDANNGGTIQVGTTFYRYGMCWDTGWYWNNSGGAPAINWCGIKVYTSTDLSNKAWTYQGKLFDPTPYSTICTNPGCGGPTAAYNAANNNYVVWFQQAGGNLVFTCPTPTGGATPTTPGTNCVFQGYKAVGYNGSIFVDPTTNMGYFAGSGGGVWQLDSSYTNPTGSFVAAGSGEAYSMFYRSGTYYVLSSGLCPFCGGTHTDYVSASSPLGPYSAPTQISALSCNGQNGTITLVPDGTGGTQYIWEADLWHSQNGSTQNATERYKEPLTFSGSAINPITCSASKTVSGVIVAPPATKPAGSDQSSWPLGQFRAVTTLGNSVVDYGNSVSNVLQTFVPTHTGTLTAVRVAVGLGETFPNNSDQTPPNQPLTVSIVTLDGSGNPLATLSSASVPATSVTWAPVSYTITGLSAGLTGGVTYGIELSTTSTNATDYTIGVAANNPYPAGTYKVSLDSGSTWTTQAGNALLFSTFGP